MASPKELYRLTKEMLFAKFNGLCAFCGYSLSDKWHIWEIEPVNTVVTADGEIAKENDTYENKLPACISCNTTRIHNSGNSDKRINVEQFRIALYREFEFMKISSMTSTYYNKAIRYGLIQETGKEIKFYFETIQPPDSTLPVLL